MIKLRLFLMLLFFSAHSSSADSPSLSLDASGDQQGQFIQQKHLKVLSQPFVTKGNYHYQQNIGLVWNTKLPLVSELKITSEGVSERQPDGNFKTLTNNAQFSELLLALFSGQQQSLQQQFTLTQQENTLTLIPKVQQISQIFERITLLLSEQGIQKITLYEPQGNYTTILLSQNSLADTQD
ncbi:outer membrane lipoprotein carrier protein LolA [uncultured Paraglaciecola sp.]|uniref:outer membrane lipoprotein carrier protein LolA n=1 Tax=uncultured Paraglaciecola sp. TaxID=1765024 RepID=UPI00262AFF4F|nr:outer membrane lipoprotein carrier protein LolA [uncultured Paraglaciecola sp.]